MQSKRTSTWLRRVGAVLAVLVLLIIVLPWVAGALLPREHVGRGEVTLSAPIEEVWESVSGFDKMGEWAPDVASLTRVADVNGLPSYEMRGPDSIVSFTFTEVSAPKRLTVALHDDSEAYGGVWTYELAEVEGGTRVSVTEEGWTEPAYFRFVLWVLGHDRTIDTYLGALAKKHGD